MYIVIIVITSFNWNYFRWNLLFNVSFVRLQWQNNRCCLSPSYEKPQTKGPKKVKGSSNNQLSQNFFACAWLIRSASCWDWWIFSCSVVIFIVVTPVICPMCGCHKFRWFFLEFFCCIFKTNLFLSKLCHWNLAHNVWCDEVRTLLIQLIPRRPSKNNKKEIITNTNFSRFCHHWKQ